MTDTTKIDTETGEESLFRTVDNSIAQILRAIEVVEAHLREKRKRIVMNQMHRDRLVNEVAELNKALESENMDLIPSLNAVINDLDTDGTIVK